MRDYLGLLFSFIVPLALAVPTTAEAAPEEMLECLEEASDCGDVFGDLIHVLRDRVSGQPILAQRWVELPAAEPGYGWGYCPIAVDSGGRELGFLPYSCDPANPAAVQEVDYFGRLNAGRTKERNNRMHFNEVISTIQSSDYVTSDEAGRLMMGSDCLDLFGAVECAQWKTIDSPMENLGLYTRLMKYGHLQTDPEELDPWAHGDPGLPPQYHPALSAEDWPKFAPEVRHLLPGDGTQACFPGAGFLPQCAESEWLLERDMVRGAAFLAGAADKTGEITADLVQYINRILKIPENTDYTVATKATVPALVRDCWDGADPPSPGETDPNPVDPPYKPVSECDVAPADDTLPGYDLFYEVRERFVEFLPAFYVRDEWQADSVEVILPVSDVRWSLEPAFDIQGWLVRRNGTYYQHFDIRSFVGATRDWLRVIEFIHNYSVPEDLYAEAGRPEATLPEAPEVPVPGAPVVECNPFEASGCGDVFGDLVHIARQPLTGQPILAQRWIELPESIPGYGWGYCPIAVDAGGQELAFVPYTCDVADPGSVVEVDYFGRLSGGRTKERNSRMHFDEVITTLKSAGFVYEEETGRLLFGFDCVATLGDPPDMVPECGTWKTIDSPMESLALYTRLLKYGHLQTDPLEEDIWAHGDPDQGPQYHPALGEEDWPKFHRTVQHLLPGNGLASCFTGAGFDPTCAEPELLADRDFVRGGVFLAAAADKTGQVTVDLVQYLNRILKITLDTETTVSNPLTLPALVRNCWRAADPPIPPDGDPNPEDPPYLPPEECQVLPADPAMPNYDLYPEVQERFVNHAATGYERDNWFGRTVEAILPDGADWLLDPACDLRPWILDQNGTDEGWLDLDLFVLASNDALRAIEFVHNYSVPVDLINIPWADHLFFDGFESGDTAAWSATIAP